MGERQEVGASRPGRVCNSYVRAADADRAICMMSCAGWYTPPTF